MSGWAGCSHGTLSSAVTGRGARGAAGSGCSGQELGSPSGTARGMGSLGVARAAVISRAVFPCARTIFGSITTSVGPPIISRCSTLSRRISTSRRRPSTVLASITASRGWRLRAACLPKRPTPKPRTSQKIPMINTSTITNETISDRGVDISIPKRVCTVPSPLRLRASTHPFKKATVFREFSPNRDRPLIMTAPERASPNHSKSPACGDDLKRLADAKAHYGKRTSEGGFMAMAGLLMRGPGTCPTGRAQALKTL